jgi:hypothetical protein
VVILRAFLALAGGFAVIALLTLALEALLKFLVPSWMDTESKPTAGYVFVNLGSLFLAAAAGGYVTAWIAVANPLIHALALGMVVLALAALSAMQARGKQPIWYLLALVAVSPIGVVAGGLVRLRVVGIL